jgi:hypothetical protein
VSDVLKLLPPFEWRGQKYPVTARNVGFTHENVQHQLQYRNNALVEQTGARNLTFSYTIPMRQDIARGPYRNLFTEGLITLLRDCRNKEPGDLVDPLYGAFICTPQGYTDESDVQKRDGTDIRLEFMHADPSEDETIDPPRINDINRDAGALEEELTAIDWHQEPSPEGMTDPLSAVAGLFNQIDQAGNRIVAGLHDYAFRLEKVEQSLDRLENPEHWGVRQVVRRHRLASHDIADRAANPQREIVVITTRYARSITAVAAEIGISTAELIRLNPAFARNPVVPAGAQVRAPRRGRPAA